MIYLTSDLHFGHDRSFLYEPRGFKNIIEHDEAIISNWNSVITNEDIVYILGDCMLNNNEHGMDCLRQLSGKKFIVPGNHDTDNRRKLYEEVEFLTLLPEAIRLTYKKYHFFLCHYPVMTGNLEKEHPRQMTLCLCGHTHSKAKFYNDLPYIYNVALDAHDNKPVSLDQIIEDMKNKFRTCKEETREEFAATATKEPLTWTMAPDGCLECVRKDTCYGFFDNVRCSHFIPIDKKDS